MYNNYSYVFTDHLARFGCDYGDADAGGAFCLEVNLSSTHSDAHVGGRLIKFGD